MCDGCSYIEMTTDGCCSFSGSWKSLKIVAHLSHSYLQKYLQRLQKGCVKIHACVDKKPLYVIYPQVCLSVVHLV